jgi:APA family basic amino acid/polyamine antiporter
MGKSGLISVPVATAVGLGAIIGAGIFVLSGTAIALAGADALIAFLIVGFVAILVALELGELGSIIPNEQGASYSYVYNAFGSELGFITGVIFYFSSATAISAISLGFGSYLANLLGMSSGYAAYLAIPLILILAVLNFLGIKKAANADFVLVLIKLVVLLVFVLFAFNFAFGLGHFSTFNFGVDNSQSGLGPIAAASIAIFFAYSGFQTISTMTSKISGGPNAAARAILLSVILSLIVYLVVVISLILLVPTSVFTVSAADPISRALSYASAPSDLKLLIDIGALVATASAALAMLLRSSRIIYQLGRDGLLPKILSQHDPKKDVSANGILATAIMSVVALFSGNVYIIAAISVFGVLFTYLMSSFALIHFRRIRKAGSFKSPFYPYLSVVAIVLLLAFICGMPIQSLIIGVIMIISLLSLYYVLREYDEKKAVKIRLFQP